MSLSKVSAKSSREPYKDMQVLPSLSFDAIHHLILQFQWDSLVLEEDEQRVRVGLRLPTRLWTHWVPALPQHHKPHVMMQWTEIPFFDCLPFQALRLSQPQLEPPLHVEWRDSAKILDGRSNLNEKHMLFIHFVHIGEGDLRHIRQPNPILHIVIAKSNEAKAHGQLAHFKVNGEISKLGYWWCSRL